MWEVNTDVVVFDCRWKMVSANLLCVVSLLFAAGCVHAVNPFDAGGSSAFDGDFGDLDLVS